MTEGPIVQAIDVSGEVKKPDQVGRGRQSLSLAWTIDPATGKPAARWVVEATEPALSATLSSAA